MGYFSKTIRHALENGVDPNQITKEFEADLTPLAHAKDWAYFGDGKWRPDTICSLCGLWAAGVCGHQGDPSQEIILRSEYTRRLAAKDIG